MPKNCFIGFEKSIFYIRKTANSPPTYRERGILDSDADKLFSSKNTSIACVISIDHRIRFALIEFCGFQPRHPDTTPPD